MSVESEIVDWFAAKTDEQIQSFKEVQRGAAICVYLCDLSEKPDLKSQIQPGTNYEERQLNYDLAKSLIEDIGLEFTYDIDKLARLDKSEFIRFAQDIMRLEEDDEQIQYDNGQQKQSDMNDMNDMNDDEEEAIDENMNDFDFESLFADLDSDLHQKMQEIRQFQDELDTYGSERNFYLSKLTQIEKACSRYSKKDSEPVIKVLQLSSTDFAPVSNEDSS